MSYTGNHLNTLSYGCRLWLLLHQVSFKIYELGLLLDNTGRDSNSS
jgi:hypothetical protein